MALRLACAVLVLLAPLTAAAAPPPPCTTAPLDTRPHDTRLRVYQLDFVKSGDPGSEVFAPRGDTEFPAIREDGSMIAQLFFDEEDFTGFPITTLVLWNKVGMKIASIPLGGRTTAPTAESMQDANAHLGKSRWRPLATFQACGDDPDVVSTIRFDGNLALTLHAKTQQLMRGKRVLAAKFPEPGQQMRHMTGTTGGCGYYSRLEYGFGGRAIGFVVLVAHANLGGDSCFGLPSADLAIAVPVR